MNKCLIFTPNILTSRMIFINNKISFPKHHFNFNHFILIVDKTIVFDSHEFLFFFIKIFIFQKLCNFIKNWNNYSFYLMIIYIHIDNTILLNAINFYNILIVAIFIIISFHYIDCD